MCLNTHPTISLHVLHASIPLHRSTQSTHTHPNSHTFIHMSTCMSTHIYTYPCRSHMSKYACIYPHSSHSYTGLHRPTHASIHAHSGIHMHSHLTASTRLHVSTHVGTHPLTPANAHRDTYALEQQRAAVTWDFSLFLSNVKDTHENANGS